MSQTNELIEILQGQGTIYDNGVPTFSHVLNLLEGVSGYFVHRLKSEKEFLEAVVDHVGKTKNPDHDGRPVIDILNEELAELRRLRNE